MFIWKCYNAESILWWLGCVPVCVRKWSNQLRPLGLLHWDLRGHASHISFYLHSLIAVTLSFPQCHHTCHQHMHFKNFTKEVLQYLILPQGPRITQLMTSCQNVFSPNYLFLLSNIKWNIYCYPTITITINFLELYFAISCHFHI